MKFSFTAKQKVAFPVHTMCRLLDASPSGFYAFTSRSPVDALFARGGPLHGVACDSLQFCRATAPTRRCHARRPQDATPCILVAFVRTEMLGRLAAPLGAQLMVLQPPFPLQVPWRLRFRCMPKWARTFSFAGGQANFARLLLTSSPTLGTR